MGRDVLPTQDYISKDFFAHPQTASDLLNTVMSRAARALGIDGPFRPAHVRPVLGQELQSLGTADSRRVDLVFWIQDSDQGQILGVVHVEVQDRIQSSMPARCLVYAARLKEHLLKAGVQGSNGLPVPLQQLLVHTGRGAWTRHRPVVAHTGIGDLWDTSHVMPLLDIGAYPDAAWSELPLTTETSAFVCLTLLHRDVSKLFQGGQAHMPAYVGRMEAFFQKLYNLSVRRNWSAHGLDETVTRWIKDGIVATVADTGHFTPRLRSARTLEEIVMDTQTLTAELNAAWEQIRAEGRAQGRAQGRAENRAELTEMRRRELLDAAAPYLSPETLHRCDRALSLRDWDDLPHVADVAAAIASDDVPQALETLFTGVYTAPHDGDRGRF